MPRVARPWFRVYVEMFPDRKIRRLSPAQRWLWVAVMGAARESLEPGRLMVAEGIPMTVEELADYAGMREKEVTSGLDLMEKLGMVHRDDAVISVPKFLARQFESDDVTARTRAYRERSKERSNDVPKNVSGNGSPSRARVGAETEADTEVSTSVANSPSVEPDLPDGNDVRSKPVNVQAAIISREYTDRVKLADRAKVAGVVQQAIDGGYEQAAIKAALRRLAKDSRPVTPDTLRIEIEGKGAVPGREPKPVYTPPRDGRRGREGW